MKVSDFKIGLDFWMSGKQYRCTDIGSRIITAIHLNPDQGLSWLKGPPYAVVEQVIDENDMPACMKSRK